MNETLQIIQFLLASIEEKNKKIAELTAEIQTAKSVSEPPKA